ncbi:hypothetical protein TWF730_004519 [Orbilia blumenaviensis]|uniref:Uncharacterized protein n=1 Tax=Orbilia blumenaviensis TaxID=1796055 RepID=A0AAV9U0S8_9PEZI
MAPPAYSPPPDDFKVFSLDPTQFPQEVDQIPYHVPLDDNDSDHSSFGFVRLPLFPGSVNDVPGLSTSSSSPPPETYSVSSEYGRRMDIFDSHAYSRATFLYSYSGALDIEYFDAVTENTGNMLLSMRNLAIIPRCGLEREKFISKIEATPDSWKQLQEPLFQNLFFLIRKLMSRVPFDQLDTFQFDEPNAGEELFPALHQQLNSLLHLSLHETSFVSHFSEGEVPQLLQSLVLHGINISQGEQFLSFLIQIMEYRNSLSYLSLDFEGFSFPSDVNWVGLEKHFRSLRALLHLKCLAIANCNDMMALQFGALNLIPWNHIQRLKIVNCPSTEAGGCLGLTRRLKVTHLTHLTLIRTCSTKDAAEIISGLEVGLHRLHLEFSYEQGQISPQCLFQKHGYTLRYLWIESSTGKRFRLVESTTGKEPSMKDFTQFKHLRELAIAIRYSAIEQYAIEWEDPPNLRIFRILNIAERYVHLTKDGNRCVCQITNDFARIHDDEVDESQPNDLEVIVMGRYIENAPDVEPMYYWVGEPKMIPSQPSAIPTEGMQSGGPSTIPVTPLRHGHEHQNGTRESSDIYQQPVEYDAGDEAEASDRPPLPALNEVEQPHLGHNLQGQYGNGDGESPAREGPSSPDKDLNYCTPTTLEQIKYEIQHITIVDVDRQGAPMWEKDEMILEQYSPNPGYHFANA